MRQRDDRVEVVLARAGNAWGIPFTLGKTVALAAGGRTIDIAYRIEGSPGFRQHLAVEFNFAGMPADAPGRAFRDGMGRPLGHLGTRLDLAGATTIGLVDDWVDIDARLTVSGTPPEGIWTFPIRTVSQSEGASSRSTNRSSSCPIGSWKGMARGCGRRRSCFPSIASPRRGERVGATTAARRISPARA